MKTKLFLSVSFLSHVSDIITIIMCVVFAIYLMINIQFINIEKLVLNEYIITSCFVAKLLIFLNLFISLLSSYSINLSSKILMKYTAVFSILTQLLGINAIIYFINYYVTFFSSILRDKFYSRPRVSILLENYFPGKPYSSLKDLCVQKMTDVINIFIFYETFSIILMLLSTLILVTSLYTKLTVENEAIPVIQVLSRAGLNTSSLRTKRVVEVTV